MMRSRADKPVVSLLEECFMRRASRSGGILFHGFALAMVMSAVVAENSAAQVPGSNVNMVSGTSLPGGDPFLQRQNEPSMAGSSRNPQHLLAGANDYRTVDLPGLPGDVTGDAWLGL